MKKLLPILLVLGIFTACSDDKPQPELAVDAISLSFGAAQESQSIAITSNIAWTITSSDSWCTVSPTSGNGTATITVNAMANDGTGARPATITISSALGNKELPVTQLGLEPVLIIEGLENDEVHANVEGTVEVQISTNADLEVSTEEDWIHFIENIPTQSSTIGRTLSFMLDENDTGAERRGAVELKDKNSSYTKTLTIVQSGSWRQADSLTLLTIYQKMDGANWDAIDKWDITKPLDQWNAERIILNAASGGVEFISITIPATLANEVSIPSEIGDLHNLTGMRILGRKNIEQGISKLTGTLPVEIANLSKLSLLSIKNSGISGSIPPEYGRLSALAWILLDGNDLTGSIPPELGQLNKVIALQLYDNRLSGSIPSEIGQMELLEYIYIRNNQLTGSIPASIAQLENIRELDLRNNLLTGTLSSELSTMNQLLDLRLSNNQLSGEIPAWLNQLSNLVSIELNGNNFTGSIPTGLGDMPSLSRLDLSNNQLSGEIPTDLGQIIGSSPLIALNDNNLTGSIPETMGSINPSRLFLKNNRLTGSIPNALLIHASWLVGKENICPQQAGYGFTNCN